MLLANLASGLACGGNAPAAMVPSPTTQALLERAQLAERQRDYGAARGLYREAVDRAPDVRNRAYASRELASALAFWGLYSEARAALEVAVAADPSLVSAWHDLGILRARAGLWVEARRALEQAVERAPREPRSRIALAALLVQRRALDEAAHHYRVLLQLEIPETIRRAVHRALDLIRAEKARSG